MLKDLPPPPSWRGLCHRCRRAPTTCFCAQLQPFESGPKIIILIHPKEARATIGTARLTHLSIAGSELIEGDGPSFDRSPRLQALLEDPTLFPVLLYPGARARKLGEIASAESEAKGRRLAVILVDGTWDQARRMIRDSWTLQGLPQVTLEPARESTYRFRKQPRAGCISTIEATHEVIEGAARAGLYPLPAERAHDRLLEMFDWLVEVQLEGERKGVGRIKSWKLLPQKSERPCPSEHGLSI